MRAIALLASQIVVLGSLAACAGELAPDASGHTTSRQQTAETGEESAKTSGSGTSATSAPAIEAREQVASSTDALNLPPNDSSYPRPTWGKQAGSCLLDVGPAAPGECTVGEERECPDTVEGHDGSWGCHQRCINVSGASTWSQPTTSMACRYNDTNLFAGHGDPSCMCNTPLVLSFDDQPVVFTTQATGTFDLTRKGMSHAGDWPTAVTPWLAIDRDGNGTIDDGGELFGSATRLASGGFATNGFEALRDLDDNHDGTFDADDAAFTKIVVWSDRNADRVSTPNEMTTLTEAGVTSIDLRDHRDSRCDARGNCEGERSRFTMTAGRRGTVIDVYLPMR